MNRVVLTVAAVTAVSGLCFVPATYAASATPAQSSSAMTSHDQTPDTAGINSLLADITNDALTRNDLSSLVSNFTTASGDRIEKSATYHDGFTAKLDGRIEQINKAWKAKYGHDFDIKNAGTVYSASFTSIRQANSQSDPQLAQEVCGNPAPSANAKNMKANNQDVAMVTVEASGKRQALSVPLIKEGSQWRLHAPASLDASMLRQNLLNHLTHFGDNSSKWPANESQAYQAATRTVLSAILESNSTASASPANAMHHS